MSARRSHAAAVCAIVLLSVVSAVGCGDGQHARPQQSQQQQRPAVAPADPLAAGFAAFSAGLPGTVGLAYAPVGGNTAVALGHWTSGVAWSTSKVPLAVAALRAFPTTAPAYAGPAITASDNAAAEQLWELLGQPDQAAAAVDAVLRQGGDAVTVVQSRRVRPEYTAFGQTEWNTTQQALFTAHLPCIPVGPNVIQLMHNLIPDDQWGLARIAGAAVKGGWGPNEAGRYLVRQLALIPNGAGRTAVVIAAEPQSGAFTDGIGLLDQITRWVTANLARFPAGHC